MQNDRIFDIADIPFSQVPEEEMKRYVSDIKATGSYRGFKPRRIWVSAVHIVGGGTSKILRCAQEIDNGVRDQLEHYNSAPASS